MRHQDRRRPPSSRRWTTAPPAKRRILRATLDAYYAADPRPVVFDKSLSWLAHLELAEAVLGCRARMLVPVRDILASFEKLWRQAPRRDRSCKNPSSTRRAGPVMARIPP